MRIGKRITGLMSAIGIFALMSTTVYADSEMIIEASAYVTEPEIGAEADFNATVEEGAGYSVEEVKWRDQDHNYLTEGDTFAADNKYTVEVYLRADGGNYFPGPDTMNYWGDNYINNHELDSYDKHEENTGTVSYGDYGDWYDFWTSIKLLFHFGKLEEEATEPQVTDPPARDPEITDPPASDPVDPPATTDPEPTEPEVTEPVVIEEPPVVEPPHEEPASEPAPEPVLEPAPAAELPVVEELPAPKPAPVEIVLAEEPVPMAAVPSEPSFDILPFEGSEEVRQAMQDTIAEQFENEEFDFEIFEVNLMVPDEDGNLVVASPENFPEDGKLTVTLPYPEGTNKDDYKFIVSHMFTTDFFGKNPGDIETPEVRLTEDGVEFDVTGLSPIALGWLKIFDINPEPDVVVTTITPDGEVLEIEEEAVAKTPAASKESFWAIIASMGTLAFAAMVYIIIDKRHENRF